MAEWQGELHQGGQVVLDSSGNGSLTFIPDNARQRWEVREIHAWCDQQPGQPLPMAEYKVVNESRGRGLVGHSGASSSYKRPILVGPADYLTIALSGNAPGATVFLQIEGAKFT